MSGNLQKTLQLTLEKAASATHRAVAVGSQHNTFVNQFGRELTNQGIKFQHEQNVTDSAGNVCKPDLAIMENGRTVAYVEIKTGLRRNIEMDQIRKYQEAGKDVYLVHFKPDGSSPSVDKY